MNILLILCVAALFAFIYFKLQSNKKHNANASSAPEQNVGGGGIEYINNTSTPLEVTFTSSEGQVVQNYIVQPGQSICVLEGTLYGDGAGYLIQLGNC